MILLMLLLQAKSARFSGFSTRRSKVPLIFRSRLNFPEWNSINGRRPWIFWCLPLITPVIRRGVNNAQVVNIKDTQCLQATPSAHHLQATR